MSMNSKQAQKIFMLIYVTFYSFIVMIAFFFK